MRAARTGATGASSPKQSRGSAVTTASAPVDSASSLPSSSSTGPTAANGPRRHSATSTRAAAGATAAGVIRRGGAAVVSGGGGTRTSSLRLRQRSGRVRLRAVPGPWRSAAAHGLAGPRGTGTSLEPARRARLVADGGGLENRYGVTPIVGSNPTPSAACRHAGDAAVMPDRDARRSGTHPEVAG